MSQLFNLNIDEYDVKELESLIQTICSPINPKQAMWYVG